MGFFKVDSDEHEVEGRLSDFQELTLRIVVESASELPQVLCFEMARDSKECRGRQRVNIIGRMMVLTIAIELRKEEKKKDAKGRAIFKK
ncbi:hypothetical protein FRX31_017282 [Thalictrum thalictroides]|uniref:Uncharacterized protein n=1 Tax=Thalictrum thalictroides TaxID=46969 RepID=A0A7J6WA95_THATH|nr:hypothetical protein FRX31_017282 [Thalictrum thalictroides]